MVNSVADYVVNLTAQTPEVNKKQALVIRVTSAIDLCDWSAPSTNYDSLTSDSSLGEYTTLTADEAT